MKITSKEVEKDFEKTEKDKIKESLLKAISQNEYKVILNLSNSREE